MSEFYPILTKHILDSIEIRTKLEAKVNELRKKRHDYAVCSLTKGEVFNMTVENFAKLLLTDEVNG